MATALSISLALLGFIPSLVYPCPATNVQMSVLMRLGPSHVLRHTGK